MENTSYIYRLADAVHHLPSQTLDKQVIRICEPMQRAQVFEALRNDPNPAVIQALQLLIERLTAGSTYKVASLESVSKRIGLPKLDKDELRKAAIEAAKESEKGGWKPKAKDDAERAARVVIEEARITSNWEADRARVDAAVEMVHEILLDPSVDNNDLHECELPEWVTDQFENTCFQEAERFVARTISRETRAKTPRLKLEVKAAMRSAEALAEALGVTIAEIREGLEDKAAQVDDDWKAFDDEPEVTETSLDNPPVEQTATEVKKRYRVQRQRSQGIDAASMGAANGVK